MSIGLIMANDAIKTTSYTVLPETGGWVWLL